MCHHPAHNLAEAKIMLKETLQYTIVKIYLGALRGILEQLTTGEIKEVSDFWVQEDSAKFPSVSLRAFKALTFPMNASCN